MKRLTNPLLFTEYISDTESERELAPRVRQHQEPQNQNGLDIYNFSEHFTGICEVNKPISNVRESLIGTQKSGSDDSRRSSLTTAQPITSGFGLSPPAAAHCHAPVVRNTEFSQPPCQAHSHAHHAASLSASSVRSGRADTDSDTDGVIDASRTTGALPRVSTKDKQSQSKSAGQRRSKTDENPNSKNKRPVVRKYVWRCAKCSFELPTSRNGHDRMCLHVEQSHPHTPIFFCKVCNFGGVRRALIQQHAELVHHIRHNQVGRNVQLVRVSNSRILAEAQAEAEAKAQKTAASRNKSIKSSLTALRRKKSGAARRTVTIVDITSLRVQPQPDSEPELDPEYSVLHTPENEPNALDDAAPTEQTEQPDAKAKEPERSKLPSPGAAFTSVPDFSRRRVSNAVHLVNPRFGNVLQQPVLLPCDLCPFITRNLTDFLGHVRTHQPCTKRRVRCSNCTYWARSADVLKRHIVVHRNDYYDFWVRRYNGRSLRHRLDKIILVRNKMKQERRARFRELELQAARLFGEPPPPPPVYDSETDESDDPATAIRGTSSDLATLSSPSATHSPIKMKRKRTTIKIREQSIPSGSTAEFDADFDSFDPVTDPETRAETPVLMQTVEMEGEERQIASTSDSRLRPRAFKRVKQTGKRRRKRFHRGAVKYQGEKVKYTCEKCPFATRSAGRLARHSALHGCNSANGCRVRFQCRFCDYGANDASIVTAHEAVHEQNECKSSLEPHASNAMGALRIYKRCAPLAAAVTDQTQVSENLDSRCDLLDDDTLAALHVDRLPSGALRCPRCPFARTDKLTLLRHLARHAMQDGPSCPFCDYRIADVADAKLHVELHFGNGDLLGQLGDGRDRETVDSLLSLVRQRLLPPVATCASPNAELVCRYCDRSDFADSVALQSHVQAHRVGAPV